MIKNAALRVLLTAVFIFVCAPFMASTPMGSANYSDDWNITGTTGGTTGSANYELSGNAGQDITEYSESSIYSLTSGFWGIFSQPPPGEWTLATGSAAFGPRYGQCSASFNGNIYVIGGTDGAGKSDVWYSSDGTAWYPAADPAAFGERNASSCIVYDDGGGAKMWLIAGISGTYKNDVWHSSDGVNWTAATAAAAFPGRAYSDTVVYAGKMWVVAGRTGSSTYVNDVWWSINGIDWNAATRNAEFAPRAYHKVLSYNNKLWLVGGYDGAVYFPDVWFSDDGVVWNQATNSAAFGAKSGFGALVFNDDGTQKMWVIGGSSQNDVWYSTDGSFWQQKTAAADFSGRSYFSSVVHDNRMWVIGGFSGSYEGDVWYSQTGYLDPFTPTPTNTATATPTETASVEPTPWPPVTGNVCEIMQTSQHPLTSALNSVSYRFTAPYDMEIDQIHLHGLSIGGINYLIAGIQNDAVGNPSGTYISQSIAKQVSDYWNIFGITPITLQKGVIYHVVVRPDLLDTGYNMAYTSPNNRVFPEHQNFDPAAETLFFDGVSWSESDGMPVFFLRETGGKNYGNVFTSNFETCKIHGNGTPALGDDSIYAQRISGLSGNVTVNRVKTLVKKNGNPMTPLKYKIIQYPSEVTLAEGILASAADLGLAGYTWQTAAFPEILLDKNFTYRVVFYCDGADTNEFTNNYIIG
ncbi:MAG TPA: hypothetical protein ENN55_05575, partial [Firmicutes bacterium]|nr:hypothetical protein [Bacillota bacterium]